MADISISQTGALQPGQTLGDYRVIRKLGQGGMGAVYEAEHLPSRTHVALKVFTADGAEAESLRQRFQTEARLLARLRHPGLVRVTNRGIDEKTGLLYFVMDLILSQQGELQTLADVSTGDLDEKTLLQWFGELASVLDYIHAEGVVHRDIKLENVLLDAGEHAILSDFGIARILSPKLHRDVNAARTLVREVAAGRRLLMGTAGYLAPEVERGDVPTAAADVYALGVLFIYLLSGMWYVSGSKVTDLLAEMTYRWDEVLPPMVATDPSDRPTDLTALAHILTVSRFASKIWKRARHYIALLLAAVVGGVVVTVARLLFER